MYDRLETTVMSCANNTYWCPDLSKEKFRTRLHNALMVCSDFVENNTGGYNPEKCGNDVCSFVYKFTL